VYCLYDDLRNGVFQSSHITAVCLLYKKCAEVRSIFSLIFCVTRQRGVMPWQPEASYSMRGSQSHTTIKYNRFPGGDVTVSLPVYRIHRSTDSHSQPFIQFHVIHSSSLLKCSPTFSAVTMATKRVAWDWWQAVNWRTAKLCQTVYVYARLLG